MSGPIQVTVQFGYCKLEQRMVPGPNNDILCQGRSKRFDQHGVLVKTGEWSTVSRIYWPAEPAAPPLPWWKRLFALKA